MKLGDIKPTGTTWDGSSIIFLNGNGGTDKFTDARLGGQVWKQFYYLNATEAKEFGCDEGWYQYSDEDSEYLMNDIAIPYGQGILFDCKNSGATLGFAGEVKNGATLNMVLGKFNFTGNVTPTDLKLGDFTCNNTTWDGSSVIFLNKNGGTDKFTDARLGETAVWKQFYYLNTTEAKEYDVDPGWYQYSDEDSEYPMNLTIDIPAGSAFLFDCKNSGAQLVVPTVL